MLTDTNATTSGYYQYAAAIYMIFKTFQVLHQYTIIAYVTWNAVNCEKWLVIGLVTSEQESQDSFSMKCAVTHRRILCKIYRNEIYCKLYKSYG